MAGGWALLHNWPGARQGVQGGVSASQAAVLVYTMSVYDWLHALCIATAQPSVFSRFVN